MPTYTPWTTLAQLIVDYNGGAGHPQGTDSAADLDDAIRQLQGFLINFLSVSFDPVTSLPKASAFSADSFADGVVPGSAIQGSINGEKITAGTISSAQLKVADVDGDNAAVATNNISDGAVTADKLSADAVTIGKIATGAINLPGMFLAGVVNTAALADDSVTDDKLADNLSGSHLASGSVPATALKITDLGGSGFGIPYVNGVSAASNKIARIGGALTASYNAGTNTIEFAVAAASSANVYKFVYLATDASATSQTKRVGLSKVSGGTAIAVDGTDSGKLVFAAAGTWLVMFSLTGYSTESFQAQLIHNGVTGTPVAVSDVAFFGLGQGGSVHGAHALTVAASDFIHLYHLSGRVQAVNGLGYTTLTNAQYGSIILVQLA